MGRGWLRRPSQPAADHQLRTGQSRGLGVAEQVGDERTGRFAGGRLRRLDARRRRPSTRPSVAPAAARASCAEAWARLRPPAVVASVRVTSWTRAGGGRGVVGGGPGPCRRRHGCPRRSRRARRAPAPTRSWKRPPAHDRRARRRRRRSAPRPRRRRAARRRRRRSRGATSTRWHVTDRASSAAVSDAARAGRSVTTAQDPHRAPARARREPARRRSARTGGCCRRRSPGRPRPWRRRGGRRPRAPGRARPPRRCAPPRAGGARRRPPPPTHRRRAPGRCTTRTRSPTRYAPSGPRSSGPGIEQSDIPPPREAPPVCRARSTAAATIRVAAMGDTALTVTPGGADRPSCHVRAATARLAQL